MTILWTHKQRKRYALACQALGMMHALNDAVETGLIDRYNAVKLAGDCNKFLQENGGRYTLIVRYDFGGFPRFEMRRRR